MSAYRLLASPRVTATVSKSTYRAILTSSRNHLTVPPYPTRSVQYTTPTTSIDAGTEHGLQYSDELFNYTRGRFPSDERQELAQRHVTYDVRELTRTAAQAVNAGRCISIKKYPDGMYNRVLLLSMDNGIEVVAKIPNPNSGRPHFTTASEVATMKFAHDVLGTPLPKVYAWNSRIQGNPVGAEYIIMEKLPGVELDQVWPKMYIEDRLKVVQAIAEYQKAWHSVSFEKFGSLYFSEDFESGSPLTYTNREDKKIQDSRFTIGSSNGREFFDDGRRQIEFDRGPWTSLEEYHTALGKRELTCVRQVAHLPPSPVTLRGPGLYETTREKKCRAIDVYLKLLKTLLPEDASIATAHVWHNDLHGGNIFVDPSDPTKVIGVIDWQSTEIAPLYFQARQPQIIDHEGPASEGLDRPSLPPDFDQLDPGEQRAAEVLLLKQSLCILYRKIVHHGCPSIYRSLEFQQTTTFSLLLLARNLLVDGEAPYIAQVKELKESWGSLPGTKGSPCPISFSEEEAHIIDADMEAATLGMDVMRGIREALGNLFPDLGFVSHEQYDEAVDALSQVCDQMIDDFARNEEEKELWRSQWPFKRE